MCSLHVRVSRSSSMLRRESTSISVFCLSSFNLPFLSCSSSFMHRPCAPAYSASISPDFAVRACSASFSAASASCAASSAASNSAESAASSASSLSAFSVAAVTSSHGSGAARFAAGAGFGRAATALVGRLRGAVALLGLVAETAGPASRRTGCGAVVTAFALVETFCVFAGSPGGRLFSLSSLHAATLGGGAMWNFPTSKLQSANSSPPDNNN
mmetsp:Transcript_56605/g.91622  ORF Transcript_56605/g.91622 Transcript_56605/m.91622 type:complete len:214 (+) Transcript_56605:473-1114(+)